MAGFLKKAWGAPSNAGTGNGPQQGGTGKDAVPPVEWHSEAPGERYFGFENFGNTCYANSVLQSLYFSKPFRHLVESYTPTGLSPSPASASQTTLASNTPVPPPNAPLPPSSTSSSALSAAGQAAKAFGSALSTPYAPIAAPTTKRSPTLRGGMGSGGGRGAIFSPHRRQNSVSSAGTDPSSSAGFNGGAPLSHQTTQSSFTGVGAPVTNQNGVLVRESPVAESTLLTTLRDLFSAISAQPKTLGTVAPQAFINQLKRDNEFFRSTLHQDAHEFLNYLINEVAELLEKEEKKRAEEEGRAASIVGTGFGAHAKTWVHSLFEGILTNETRCLTCETVTSRDEAFLDLSIDIEQHTSVTACLRQFSASEMLCQRNKFSCDKCCGLQEAEKRMKIKKLPNILALHLKRFKYEESLQRHVKLTYRVVFPFELRLFNTADDVGNPDRLYELWAIVVHIGVGPHHGHYITIVKSGQRWIVFDDNNVYPIEQSEIARYFGDTPGHGSGYVLFYQAVDLDLDGLDFPVPPTPSMSAAGRERTQTASSSSTNGLASSWTEDPVPPVPPLPAASVSVPVNSSTPPSAAEPPPSAPASPVVVPSALVNPMNGEDGLPSPASSAHSALPRSPSALTQLNPYAPPPPQERKVSATSLSSSISAGEKESGWSSIRGRFGRTKSQVSKDGGRRLSLGGLGSSSCLEPLSSIPAGNSQADVSALDMADQTPRPPAPAFSNATSATTTPDLAGSGELPPPVPINGSHPPAPPSEDGSVSTTSTPLHPTFPHSPSPTHSFPQRRGSRSSYTALDNPPAPSSVSSLSSSGHLPPRQPHSSAPPPASSSSSSSGAAAAPKPSSGVRGFLSRARTEKGRPATANPTTGLSSAPPAPSNGTGLGLGLVTPSGGAGGDAPAPNGGLKSRLSSSASLSGMSVLSKRPSTAAPVVSTSTSPSPLLPSSTSASTNGHPPPPAPSAPTPEPLSKKELERRDKEAKKAREQEVKERAKRDKEAAKVAKEEEKRREKEAKLLRKQSVR